MKYHLAYAKMARIKDTERDFPGCLEVNNLLCNAGLIPDRRTKIPRGAGQLILSHNQRSLCAEV